MHLSGVEAVGDIRGRGHFIATELVADRKTKKPFDGSLKLFMHVRQQALANGLICYPVGGNVDGINGDVIILAPPYNSTDAELDGNGGQDGHVNQAGFGGEGVILIPHAEVRATRASKHLFPRSPALRGLAAQGTSG